jgi:hypothetical protein
MKCSQVFSTGYRKGRGELFLISLKITMNGECISV